MRRSGEAFPIFKPGQTFPSNEATYRDAKPRFKTRLKSDAKVMQPVAAARLPFYPKYV